MLYLLICTRLQFLDHIFAHHLWTSIQKETDNNSTVEVEIDETDNGEVDEQLYADGTDAENLIGSEFQNFEFNENDENEGTRMKCKSKGEF